MYRAAVVSLVALVVSASSPVGAQATEPVFVRAQQMATGGQDSAGRAVVAATVTVTVAPTNDEPAPAVAVMGTTMPYEYALVVGATVPLPTVATVNV